MVTYDGVIEFVDDVHGEGVEASGRKLYAEDQNKTNPESDKKEQTCVRRFVAGLLENG